MLEIRQTCSIVSNNVCYTARIRQQTNKIIVLSATTICGWLTNA